VLPNYNAFRLRTLFYISQDLKVNLAQISPKDPDCIIIDLIELNIQLINIYNTIHPNIPNSLATIQRSGIFPNILAKKTIILGDFNIYYPWWDPLAPQGANSGYLIELIEKYSLNLLNIPGEGTFYRPNITIPSVIDLTFAIRGIVNQIQDWQVLPDLGSDYFGVLFTIAFKSPFNKSILNSRFNTKKADWNLFKNKLLENFNNFPYSSYSLSYSNQELDLLAKSFTSKVINIANNNIPKTIIIISAKPW
jgi:hypothetical protein